MFQLLAIERILFYGVFGCYLASMFLYIVFIALKNEKIAKIAIVLQVCGIVFNLLTMIVRGINAGRLPLTNQYEFATAFAFGLALVSIIFILKFKFLTLGAFASPVTFIVLGYAAMQSKEIHELMPALKSSWLGVHVSSAIIAYGSFGVAFVLSVIYLMKDRMSGSSFLDKHIPKKEKLDLISYRSVALGLMFLTVCIITGAIWAQKAWGSYWSWDPKETWSLITWLIYAVFLHLRLRKGWSGKTAAIFAIVGFVCVIFTYLGVNTLLPGLHSYA